MKTMTLSTFLGRSLLAFAAALACAGAAMAASPPDLTGVYQISAPPVALMQENGKPPPFKRAAKRIYDERAAARRAGRPIEDPAATCVPHGTPRLLTTAYPFEVLQSADRVAFVHEVNHTFRIINVGKARAPLDELDPTWLGQPTGRWDGDALVIDSVAFNGMTWLDAAGAPTSERLHVVERWRLIDGGRRLQARITIEDPEVFTRPWTTVLTFERRDGVKLKESVCRENGVY
jgi:hypothetical protein